MILNDIEITRLAKEHAMIERRMGVRGMNKRVEEHSFDYAYNPKQGMSLTINFIISRQKKNVWQVIAYDMAMAMTEIMIVESRQTARQLMHDIVAMRRRVVETEINKAKAAQ